MRVVASLLIVAWVLGRGPARGEVADEERGFSDMLKTECGKHGGAAAYERLIVEIEYFPHCAQLLNNVSLEVSGATDVRGGGDVGDHCHKARILNDCAKHAIEPLKSCVEPEQRETIDVGKNMIDNAISLACETEGDDASGTSGSDDAKCWKANADAVLRCARESYNLSHRIVEHDRLLVWPTEDCFNLAEFKDCSAKAIGKCDVRTRSNLLRLLVNYAESSSPCKNLLGSEPTQETEQNLSSIELEQKAKNVQTLARLMPYVHTLDRITKDAAIKIRESCTRYGGPEAYEAAKKLPKYAMDVVKSFHTTMSRFDAELKVVRTSGNLDGLCKTHCRDASATQERVKNITEIIKSCLPPESRPVVDVVNKPLDLSVEFMCRNGEERLKKFVGAGGPQCMEDKRKLLHDCNSDFLKTYVSSMDAFVLGEDMCARVKGLENCIVDVMEGCEDPAPAVVIKEFYDMIFQSSPCYGIVNREASDSTPAPGY